MLCNIYLAGVIASFAFGAYVIEAYPQHRGEYSRPVLYTSLAGFAVAWPLGWAKIGFYVYSLFQADKR